MSFDHWCDEDLAWNDNGVTTNWKKYTSFDMGKLTMATGVDTG